MAAAATKPWTLNSQLLLAIQNNDVSRASKLFHEGVDTDTRFSINSQKRPAICLCAQNNDINMVQLMLSLGASVNQKDSIGQAPLHITCEYGYFSVAKLLLDNRADIHSKNKNGHTPLHLAAQSGKTELVELLIQYGADIDKTDKLGRTALHLSALVHDSQVLELLLRFGANARVEDIHGNTALHFAVDSLGTNVRGIAALCNVFPFSAIKANDQRKTPLHIIVGADKRNEEEALKVMLRNLPINSSIPLPVMLSPRSEKGHTPLHLAVLERKVELVRILIASGAEVDTRDQLGRTPLECAVRDMHCNIIALFLAAGASIRRFFNEEGHLSHVKDSTIETMLTEASLRPLKLSSLCRRVIVRTLGPSLQRNPDELPMTWKNFLAYDEL